MKKKSLADLKNLFTGQEQEGTRQSLPNNYYPFWNMSSGQRAIIRFLPDRNENNERGFLVEKVSHTLTINGKVRSVPCLSMYGEDCPICKVSQDFYKADDKVNGKKYWRKKQYIAQALIIEDPLPPDQETGETHVGKVRGITLGYQIYNIIKEAFAGDELESIPYDFDEGYDFIIKKSDQGDYATYTIGTKFRGSQRALTEEELAAVEEGMIDLSTLLPKNPGVEKVRAMLEAELNGEDYEESAPSNRRSSSDEDDAPWTAPKAAPKKAAKPAVADDDEDEDEEEEVVRKPAKQVKPAKVETDDDAASTDVDAMLAAIRQRRAASK